ncbi:MAG TPA: phage tail protein [Thermoanaerobaculia bacterium]|nr:phage tail protein [Thermoanaerobaculia bacterium]
MLIDTPIGTVCAFAGQLDPVTGDPNNIWAGTGCSSQGSQGGKLDPNVPLNRLEQSGWMLCDGRYLLTASFPELFAVLGYLYGKRSADGAFRLPDYRGLFLRGVDAGSGMDPQASQRVGPLGTGTSSGIGSLQCDAFQDHTHTYDVIPPATATSSGNAGGQATGTKATTSPNPPARFGPETRAKNVAVNYVIKFR